MSEPTPELTCVLRVFITRPLAATLLAGLCACSPGATPPAPATASPPTTASPTTASLLVNAAAVDAKRLAIRESDQWLTPGGDSSGSYYSPLKDIDAGNVAKLGFAWSYDLGTNRGQESTPLVIDGVMYASSNFGRVYALDAASGKELWTYDPHIDGQWARYACCDAV